MSLVTEMEKHGQVLLIRLIGELDHHYAGQLRDAIEEQLEDEDVKHLIFNLEELSFMDSSGIGVILGRYKQVKAIGGEVVVCSMTRTVERIFELSGLFKIIRLEESEQFALQTLGVA